MKTNISTIAPVIYEGSNGNTVFACKPSMARKVRSVLSKSGYNIKLENNPTTFHEYQHFITDLKWVDFIRMIPETQGATEVEVQAYADKVGLVTNM